MCIIFFIIIPPMIADVGLNALDVGFLRRGLKEGPVSGARLRVVDGRMWHYRQHTCL